MAGYLGTKAVLLSTTAASVGGDATIGGDLTVEGGDVTFYEDTGTTAKFFWDASAESLSLTTVGTEALDISSTTGAAEIRMGNSNSTFDLRLGAADKASGHADFFVETGGSERMRIDSSGNLLVGTTGAIAGKTAKAGIYQTNADPVIACYTNTTGTINQIIFANPNGEIGNINSGATSVSYNTSSDYRLKEDVQPMVGATDRVLALNPVNFAWKVNGERVDGFLAHEAQAVVPEAVTGERDAVDDEGNAVYQGIDQSKLVPLLAAALQEALNEITDLKARVAALETA